MKMYLVGGAVRDEILGVKSKDIDYSVVLDELDLRWRETDADISGIENPTPFENMRYRLIRMGFDIFLETPEHLTIRAKFPKGGNYGLVKGNTDGLTADFVLARKEGTYTDGRRPDIVEPGTLMDDLRRRDFTMNAIAKGANGSLIDPFNGQVDIAAGVIRTVGNPRHRLEEDALRAVRALRFAITKGFVIDFNLSAAMESNEVCNAITQNISDERIQQELSKMFRFDTLASLNMLARYPQLTRAMFSGSVSLDATMKLKGRGGRGKIANPAPTTTIKCFG